MSVNRSCFDDDSVLTDVEGLGIDLLCNDSMSLEQFILKQI